MPAWQVIANRALAETELHSIFFAKYCAAFLSKSDYRLAFILALNPLIKWALQCCRHFAQGRGARGIHPL